MGLQTTDRNGWNRGRPDGPRTAQLVVDTAAFMAFCTDNVQTACGHNLVVFGLPTAFKAEICACFAVHQGFIGTDGFDLMFEVAAQDNIGTAAGHVGGNGNCADFTGLSDN